MSSASNDILSWTNQDPRESQLFNSWGVLYRFQVRILILHHGQDINICISDGRQYQWPERDDALAYNPP